MEDLPFGQNCSLSAWVCSEGPALGQNTDDDDIIIVIIIIIIIIIFVFPPAT